MNRPCSSLLSAVLALCALLWGASAMAADLAACGVSEALLRAVDGRVAEGALTRDQQATLLLPLAGACEDGLPLPPFEKKLEEGLAKHVAPERIAAALEEKLDDFRAAKSLLVDAGADPDHEPLTLMGEGLGEGVERTLFADYLSRFAGRPTSQFNAGLEMFSLLMQAGVNPGLGFGLLEAGFSARTLDDPWRYFVRIVLLARRRDIEDQAVLAEARKVLAQGGAPSDVAASLGFTTRDLRGRPASK